MRAFVVSMIISVDGYHAGVGGDVMAMPFDDGFSRHNVRLLRDAGTLVIGARGFDGGAYWDPVAADESQPEIEREISRINHGLDKLVVSDSLRFDPSWPWAATTRIVGRADAPREIAALKEGDGGTLLTFGSVTTWSPLLEAGLVDELHVLVGPALLGEGEKLFTGSRTSLRLIETQPQEDSQLVLLRFDASR